MITPFGPEIWICDGPSITAAAGFHYPTRMVLVRLRDGGLWVWSPIPLMPALKAAVDRLGPVQHLISPNCLHHMSMASWQAAYPEAVLYAMRGLGAKRPDLRIDVTFGQSIATWSDEIGCVLIETRITPEAVFFHHHSRTVIFTDLLQQLPPDWFKGWRKLIARLDLMTSAELAVPRKFRLAVQNRKDLREQIASLLALNPEALIVAHGPCLQTGAAPLLRRAFSWAGG
ncbi:MAG: DUF4336 domain-containing protein [Tabrizicola sp.]